MGRDNQVTEDDEGGVEGIEERVIEIIKEIEVEKDRKKGKIRVIKEEGNLHYELTWNFTVYRFTKKDIQENPLGITFKDYFFEIPKEAYQNLINVQK